MRTIEQIEEALARVEEVLWQPLEDKRKAREKEAKQLRRDAEVSKLKQGER